MKQAPTREIEQLTRGEYGQPHAILGPHPDGEDVTFRVYKPLARTVTVVTSDGARVPLEHEQEGVWVGALTPAGFESGAARPPRPTEGARGVRLEGDFNSWDGREHPMRQLGESGVWELFMPGVGAGAGYKYVVLGADGEWREKADPMAFWAEVPPATSSRVFESSHEWGDDAWMRARSEKHPVAQPMGSYEVHLGSWRKRHGN